MVNMVKNRSNNTTSAIQGRILPEPSIQGPNIAGQLPLGQPAAHAGTSGDQAGFRLVPQSQLTNQNAMATGRISDVVSEQGGYGGFYTPRYVPFPPPRLWPDMLTSV